MKTIFKIEDKVYHYKYGWGVVTNFSQALIRVNFKDKPKYLAIDNELISFTEYTLQGFSQERPIELPEVGELCLVRDYNENNWQLKKFSEYYPSDNYPYRVGANRTGYKQLKRIKILD
jgi:hypothetical protein